MMMRNLMTRLQPFELSNKLHTLDGLTTCLFLTVVSYIFLDMYVNISEPHVMGSDWRNIIEGHNT